MRGPKTMALAILVFFAGSLLVIHLSTAPDGSSAGAFAAAAPPAGAATPPGPRLAPATEGEGGLPTASPAPVLAQPVPEPGTSGDWERKVNDCVERNVHGAGYDDVKPTLPGRWPALKRAREQRRLRRLEVRATCEQQLAAG